jgi:hypothetical protein
VGKTGRIGDPVPMPTAPVSIRLPVLVCGRIGNEKSASRRQTSRTDHDRTDQRVSFRVQGVRSAHRIRNYSQQELRFAEQPTIRPFSE